MAGSSSLAAGGFLAVSGAFLDGRVGAASLAAAGAAPREHRGGHLAAIVTGLKGVIQITLNGKQTLRV